MLTMDRKILKTSAEKWKLQIIKWKHRTKDDKPESFKTDVLNREKEMPGERGASFKREKNYHDVRDSGEHGVCEMTAGCFRWSSRRWQEEGMKSPLVVGMKLPLVVGIKLPFFHWREMEEKIKRWREGRVEGGKERGRENVSLKTDYLCRFCNH